MGQDSPAQTKQSLQDVLRYVVGRGYQVRWFCDSGFCLCGMNMNTCEKRGIDFVIGNTVVEAFEGKNYYEVYINDHGPVYLKEITEESLRQAASEIVRRLMEAVTF